MTTNFYLKEEYENLYPFRREEEPRLIGKRAAAGYYCWNCRHTLMYSRVYGTKFEVPDNSSIHHPITGSQMLKRCPTCGLKAENEGFESSCGRELGFKEGNPIPKTGVKTCSSFTFALRFEELFSLLLRLALPPLKNKKTIIDEYKREYTFDEFICVLSECPIQSINENTNWS